MRPYIDRHWRHNANVVDHGAGSAGCANGGRPCRSCDAGFCGRSDQFSGLRCREVAAHGGVRLRVENVIPVFATQPNQDSSFL
jgi:hypothetical protein